MYTNDAIFRSANASRLRSLGVGICLFLFAGVVFPHNSASAEAQTKSRSQAFVSLSGSISMDALKHMLKQAEGIGLWTKLKLDRRISRFTEDFYWYHKDAKGNNLARMRERFIALHSRVVTLLQPRNPGMSKRFSDARDALWSAYRNPGAFTRTVGKNVAMRIETNRTGDANQF